MLETSQPPPDCKYGKLNFNTLKLSLNLRKETTQAIVHSGGMGSFHSQATSTTYMIRYYR